MAELKIKTFDEIEEEQVRWLWKPYIAFGKITVIQGDPGNGKTTLALWLAALISKRQAMPTGGTQPFIGNVIYQSGEDSPQDTIKPRLMACGADCSKIACIEVDGNSVMTPEMLEEAIVGTNAKYVVLDPLQAFLTGKQDISSTKNMRPILRKLGDVAARTGAAIVIIGHMNKGEKSKGIYRGLGSIDITAAARSVLLIGKREDNPNIRFMVQIKNNLAKFGNSVSFSFNEKSGVKFLGESEISEKDLLITTAPKQSKLEMAKEIITKMLATGDKKSNEVFDTCIDANISAPTIQNAKKKLGIKSVRKIDDWYWTLNPDASVFGESEDCDYDDNCDDEQDEVAVAFFNDNKTCDTVEQKPFYLDASPKNTIPSPFGELTLIDWRACV